MSYDLTVQIDWIALTFKGMVKLQDLFGECLITTVSGRWGYDTAQETEDGALILMSSTRADMGVHVVIGATALSKIWLRQQTTPIALLCRALNMKANIKRLDLCVDVKNQEFDIDLLVSQYKAGNVRTRARGGTVIRNIVDIGQTLYIGRRGSRKLLRIYDKAAQLRLPVYWTRIELELRRDAAHQASEVLAQSSSWAHEIPKLIKGFVDFDNCIQWRTVIGQDEIAITLPKVEDSKTRKWLLEVVAPSIAKLYLGGDCEIMMDVIRSTSETIRTNTKETRDLTGIDQLDKIRASERLL